jgi:hypothetical protein
MATLRVEIRREGSAFGDGDVDDANAETARILRELSNRIYDGASEGVVRDINGNPSCTFSTEGE